MLDDFPKRRRALLSATFFFFPFFPLHLARKDSFKFFIIIIPLHPKLFYSHDMLMLCADLRRGVRYPCK